MSALGNDIRRLADEGVSLNEIAFRLGVARATVGYHVSRRSAKASAQPARLPAPASAATARQVPTRDAVAKLLASGFSRVQIACRLGLTKGTVSYHARRLGEFVDERCARRYDWSVVQEYYDSGHSVRECLHHFDCSGQSWHDAKRRGLLVTRPHGMPLEELLTSGTRRGRQHVKLRLLAAGLKDERCESCGLTGWRGRTLTMALHQINGDRHDNRLENLQLPCPNCHSQTDTFGGRNGRPSLPR